MQLQLLLCMKIMGEGKITNLCSLGTSIYFTFSLTNFHRKNARRYSLILPRIIMFVETATVRGGVRPMRSHKGNGLDKGSSNKEKILCCLWRICLVILDCSDSLCQYETLNIFTLLYILLICLHCSQHSFHPFDLCL